jgi:hypothetical protein
MQAIENTADLPQFLTALHPCAPREPATTQNNVIALSRLERVARGSRYRRRLYAERAQEWNRFL